MYKWKTITFSFNNNFKFLSTIKINNAEKYFGVTGYYRLIRTDIPVPREYVLVTPEYPPLFALTPFIFIPPV